MSDAKRFEENLARRSDRKENRGREANSESGVRLQSAVVAGPCTLLLSQK